jgi:alpha-D-ribose 1-methylphosphonate 5-triphosphate synthase subunit PhnH
MAAVTVAADADPANTGSANTALPSTALPATGPAGVSRAAGVPMALTPGGAQAVFRATLDALARPGTVTRLPSAAGEPLAGHVPAALLPLLALADLSTPACVIDSRVVWGEIVRVATNAPHAALADARLVAALRPLAAGELASLRTGTAAAPEDGALACLTVAGIAIAAGTDGIAGSPNGTRLLLRLSGPGVPGTRAVIVTGLPAGFAAARHRLVAGFPAGADLLLIAPDGAMTGLPRTTEVKEETV